MKLLGDGLFKTNHIQKCNGNILEVEYRCRGTGNPFWKWRAFENALIHK
jgi:hypothetical protein